MSGSIDRIVLIALGIIGLFGIITFILAAASLGTLNKRLNVLENKLPSPSEVTTTTTATPSSISSTLAKSINIEEILGYLEELQKIADTSNGNRAINTAGFNKTIDFIYNYLTAHTNFHVNKTFFSVKDFALENDPILVSSINGVEKIYTYSVNLTIAEFIHVKYSTSSNSSKIFNLSVIPNGGCTKEDWVNAKAGTVALIKRGGNCAFADRAAHAPDANVSGILFYNDGALPDRFSPIEVGLDQDNTLPALFLSYSVGQALADAAQNTPTNVTIRMEINPKNVSYFSVGNICADTPTGDATQTIVIGSHSDSVPAGPGINDNGSGTAANLGLAAALARLFNTSTYTKYKYRVRFCWWGAEEVGLLGAKDHVKQAKNSSIIGERLEDYLINLNYDMLGSPNYIFGIYDGKTANNATPNRARQGSNKTTALFQNWFERQNLPWNYTDFNGRSDYGPFLAEGIVAGGLFSGADGLKTSDERDYYDRLLGQGKGGIAGATHDPCYHKKCDSIQNINKFAFEKMIQAAAYVLEYLGQQNDLKGWLYSSPSS